MTLTLPIKRLANVTLGKMIQSEPSQLVDTSAPYLRAAHVQPHGRIIDLPDQRMWFSQFELRTLNLLRGDVVVVEGGAGYGRSAVIREDLAGWGFQNSIIRLRPVAARSDGRFLDYSLQGALSDGRIELATSTATLPHFTADKVSKFEIWAPALDEQRAIADYLDRETAQIDALVAKQEEFKATLTERRIALIYNTAVHGLDPGAPMSPSGADWFDVAPSHWRIGRLKNSVLDSQTGVWGNDPVGDGTDVICVRVADFDRARLRVGHTETMRAVGERDAKLRLLRRGDLLLEKSGGTPLNPVGFVAMYEDEKGPAVTSNFITRLRLSDDQDPRYWLYAHAASYGTRLTARSIKQTTGIQNLDQASYFNELFPYPPLEEQLAIARYLDEQTSRIDTLIAKTEEHIALAKERRSALITAAVTGQFDVRTAGKAG